MTGVSVIAKWWMKTSEPFLPAPAVISPKKGLTWCGRKMEAPSQCRALKSEAWQSQGRVQLSPSAAAFLASKECLSGNKCPLIEPLSFPGLVLLQFVLHVSLSVMLNQAADIFQLHPTYFLLQDCSLSRGLDSQQKVNSTSGKRVSGCPSSQAVFNPAPTNVGGSASVGGLLVERLFTTLWLGNGFIVKVEDRQKL